MSYLDVMAGGSGIKWTEVTWNPTIGRERTSPGYEHWYAPTLAKRLKAMGNPTTRWTVTPGPVDRALRSLSTRLPLTSLAAGPCPGSFS